ncbi:hypothetical protein DCAR_0625241 [Daucus carota subsp. sativus]|uniref:Uncharacterized protein n=1 Tax=Daucus carota subsp. sativus TaxID=79200 RepID=A0A161XFA9_DAUCS|nr:hypothetical protein DCAR_0625241 [Daucus carota subsp. sativus]
MSIIKKRKIVSEISRSQKSSTRSNDNQTLNSLVIMEAEPTEFPGMKHLCS